VVRTLLFTKFLVVFKHWWHWGKPGMLAEGIPT
jgi:hypothetical protein